MEGLSDKQVAALEGMRKAFESADGFGMPIDDRTFLRYLRARSFDLEKASKMLQATIKWRGDMQLGDFHTSWQETIAKENATGKSYVRGYDKLGNAIVVMRPRAENTHNHEGNIKHLVYTMERAIATMEKTGQEKLCLLIDFDGYSIFNAPPMKTSRETLSILQDHYPERLFRAYLVRPPTVFYAFYRVISPFVDPVTTRKIAMLTSSEMSNPENQMMQDIDKACLEAVFGGEDSRPFVSETYLTGSFGDDFKTILDHISS